ncbi:MAG: prepilin-type N-terminal cleavage/methylation domain-containing protein [Planctomycetota bacterium]|jgi:prepilin-type N-terminal cleavage/methylation domain-containing protein|nr:prepilin-type N-terminal cleavage/methylation domain-containing protein [Planctomycetota bacterium]
MTPFQHRRGFTALELLIAIAIGSLVLMVAYSAVRMATATISAARRMDVQNQAMRSGFLVANEELDFWTALDDPDDPARQRLRAVSVQQLDGKAVHTAPEQTYGLPFVALKDLPPENQWAAGGSGFNLLAADPTLLTDAQFRDDASTGELFRLDRARGFDARPYQADDPRRWYRGCMFEPGHLDREVGRYGMFSNRHADPVLGYGDHPGVIRRDSDDHPVGETDVPGVVQITGPYGPYPPMAWGDPGLPARTFTWHEHQVLYGLQAFGSYGTMDYLPANAVLRIHGTQAWCAKLPLEGDYAAGVANGTINAPVDGWVRIDERVDHRITGYNDYGSCFNGYGRVVGQRSQALTRANATVRDWHSLRVPGSDSLQDLVSDYRNPFAGPESHHFVYKGEIRNNTWVENLLPQPPPDWPRLRLEVMRGLLRGRFFTLARIRWTDTASNEEAELVLTGIGTTLRGARQQRARDGGWAAWYGRNDTRNTPTLDQP